MKKLYYSCALVFTACFILLIFLTEAHALPQWSRKYGVSCTACHSVFPRLNYMGELFLRNGYQMPGTQDGDEAKKTRIDDWLVLSELGDVLGFRLNFTAVEMITNGLTKNGQKTTLTNVGKPSWIQIFPAGAIFKNVSTFAEIEFSPDGVAVNWLKMGIHNIFGSSTFNVRFGQLAPTEWHAASGRLRMLPPGEQWRLIKSANGKGEDSVDIGGGKPAVAVYGYTGPFLYEVGVQNGAKLKDPNDKKNFWGVLRVEKTSGALEGSSVSFFAFKGVDTKDTATAQKQDDFVRYSPAFNIRHGDLDIVGAYVYGKDDNWTLASTSPKEVVHHGYLFQAGYLWNQKIYTVLRYDQTKSKDDPSLDYQKITPSVWYLWKRNWKIGLITRFDLSSTPDKQHEYIVMVRSAF